MARSTKSDSVVGPVGSSGWIEASRGIRSRRVEVDAPLRTRMRELAAQYRRYGYLRLHVWLRQEGLVINRKRTYRVYRAEGLSVRKRLRKRLPQRERLLSALGH